MYIIAGLGNPTKEYENTRHNIGFMAIDALAEKYNISVMECKHKALIGKGMINGNKVVLVKPLTYMNLSGEAIRSVIDYYKVDEESELIVIYDDMDLAGGYRGLRPVGSTDCRSCFHLVCGRSACRHALLLSLDRGGYAHLRDM